VVPTSSTLDCVALSASTLVRRVVGMYRQDAKVPRREPGADLDDGAREVVA